MNSEASVEERFGHLATEQAKQKDLWEQQASTVRTCGEQLKAIAEEAEKVMKLEIDKTRDLEFEEIRKQPEWRRWESQLRELDGKATAWDVDTSRARSSKEREIQDIQGKMDFHHRLLNEKQENLNRIQNERDGLEQELRDLNHQLDIGKGEAMQRQDALSRGQSELVGKQEAYRQAQLQLSRHTQDRYSKLKELDEARQQVEKARSELNNLEQDIERTRQQHAEYEAKERENQQKIYQLRQDLQRIDVEVEGGKREIKRLQEIFNINQRKLAEAQAVLQETNEAWSNAEALIREHMARLQAIPAEKHRLIEEREGIQKQVEGLFVKMRGIDEHLVSVANRESEEKREIERLDNDLQRAKSLNQEAQKMIQVCQNDGQAIRHDLNSESIKYEKSEAQRTNLRNSHDLILQTNATLRKAMEDLVDKLRALEDRRNQLFATRLVDVPRLEQEIANLDQMIQHDQVNEAALLKELGTIESNVFALNDQLDRITKDQNQIEERTKAIESLLPSLAIDFEEVAKLRRAMDNLSESMSRLHRELASISTVNPFAEQLEALRRERPRIEMSLKDRIMREPSQDLKDQIKRELEVTLRAETAAGFWTRNQQLQSELNELADLRIAKNPGLEIDDQAVSRLVGEHMETRDYRRVATTIVELAEQQHIIAFSSSENGRYNPVSR